MVKPVQRPLRIVLSGCSGGGKSTMIAAVRARGYSTFLEPGRLVVDAQLASGGHGLPWDDAALFAGLMIAEGRAQWAAAKPGLNFYDRSLVDAVTWYERQPDPVPQAVSYLVQTNRYDSPVFMTPPWPDIYVSDAARRHELSDAVAEYDALCESYPAKGYSLQIIPKADVDTRINWVLHQLDGVASGAGR